MKIEEKISYINSGLSIIFGPFIGAPLLIYNAIQAAIDYFKSLSNPVLSEKRELKSRAKLHLEWVGMNALRCIPIIGGIAACILQNRNVVLFNLTASYVHIYAQKAGGLKGLESVYDALDQLDLNKLGIKNVVLHLWDPITDEGRNPIFGTSYEVEEMTYEEMQRLVPCLFILLPMRDLQAEYSVWEKDEASLEMSIRANSKMHIIASHKDYEAIQNNQVPQGLIEQIQQLG